MRSMNKEVRLTFVHRNKYTSLSKDEIDSFKEEVLDTINNFVSKMDYYENDTLEIIVKFTS